MAVPGREPSEQVRYRSLATADWTEVPDEPFEGTSPDLPRVKGVAWRSEVKTWWQALRRMPHCVLWSETDWLFALETAFMKQDWWAGFFSGTVVPTKSVEIRRREDQMGTTVEARRKLRIRYVPPVAEAVPAAAAQPGVPSLDDRRRRLTAGG